MSENSMAWGFMDRKDFILLKSVVFDIIGAERTRARKAWQGSEGRLRTREIGSG